MKTKIFPVVLTDVNMPGMDGVTLLAEIKKAWPLTEVVMITADHTMGQAVNSLQTGAFDFLLKSIDLKCLGKILRHAAEKSDMARKLMIAEAKADNGVAVVDKASPTPLPQPRRVKESLEETAELVFASLSMKDTSRNRLLLRSSFHELERSIIIQALAKLDWNQLQVAAFLGTSRNTLIRKMRLLKIPTAKQPMKSM
jgi:DNA-binding NtrC family response regulator